MAGGVTRVGANRLLDLLVGQNASAPATLYVGLATEAPTETTTGTTVSEPSGGAYARVSKTNNSTNFSAASSSTKTNATDVDFPTPTASWGTVRYWILCDASSGGNLLMWGRLSTPITIASGAAPTLAAGAMSIRIASL